MRDVLATGGVPHVWTFASSAVAVARSAVGHGIDLGGGRFTGGGEPTTEARLEAVRAVGAELIPRYGTTETDIVAYGCPRPVAPDDQHLFHDRHAVIAAERPVAGTLLVTSLLATAPIVLLNVSLGDRAELVQRSCGCALDELGWGTHIHSIRSYEKLTAGGITFIDTDVVRVLEDILPARFGGAPTDYQLAESETDGGRPLVRLIVHPRVGEIDEHAVADAFLDALAGGSGGERLMELQWRAAGLPPVERDSRRRRPRARCCTWRAASRGAGAPRP